MRVDRPPKQSARSAFTIVEATISIVVVAVALLAALTTLGAVTTTRQMQLNRLQGQALAEDLLTEILQCYYFEPDHAAADTPVFGLDAGESALSRGAWDDMDDYADWTSTPPRRRDDQELAQYAGWTRSAAVTPVDPQTLAPIVGESGVRLIEVTVTSPTGRSTTLKALRCDYSALEQAPTLDSSYVSWVGLEIQLDPEEKALVTGGINVLNHRPPPSGVGSP